ncbi:MAG: glycosyltransferase, partial [Oribacterium sp.]|nr:glycosyltransferase [Oribacterium sp.]MDY6316364.1 glycosyltransferase [Oribacterium sp.]
MITVLLCSYNGEQYIEEQLKSILDQTVKDLHVVVSDDGSTDRTLEIVEKLSDENPGRITIIRQDPPNGSAAVHFLKLFCDKKYDFSLPTPDKKASEKNGLSEVLRADYIMLSDQDDVWKPEKAEKTLAMMKEMEAKYGKDTPLLVHCD